MKFICITFKMLYFELINTHQNIYSSSMLLLRLSAFFWENRLSPIIESNTLQSDVLVEISVFAITLSEFLCMAFSIVFSRKKEPCQMHCDDKNGKKFTKNQITLLMHVVHSAWMHSVFKRFYCDPCWIGKIELNAVHKKEKRRNWVEIEEKME